MERTEASLELTGQANAVPMARRFARQQLVGCPPDQLDDVELVVAELTTNALLHAPGGAVLVRVAVSQDCVRIEVQDVGQALPVTGRTAAEAMTGRGLQLVGALSRAWGVEPTGDDGKVVWAQVCPGAALPAEPQIDLDALLAAWPDEELEPQVEVHLGPVPTELLLQVKTQADNLVRELTLARGVPSALPAELVEHAAAVIGAFAEVRHSIRDQARAAARRGDPETDLRLDLPLSAATRGQEYLTALATVDRYAAAARLLTVASPYVHQLFRRWYVETVVTQLGAHEHGRPVPPVVRWSDVLATEVDQLSGLRAAVRHTSGLHRVASLLAASVTPSEIGAAVVRIGVEVLGASSGCLVLDADGRPEVLATFGVDVPYVTDVESRCHADDELPEVQVLRTGHPLWWEAVPAASLTGRRLTALEPRVVAACVVPLVARRRLGALRFGFDTGQLFDEGAREFVLSLADQSALALQRSELYLAESAARRDAQRSAARLHLITDVTTRLTGATTQAEVLEVVATSTTGKLGAIATGVHLLQEDGVAGADGKPSDGLLRLARHAGETREQVALYRAVRIDDATMPTSEALRTGTMVVLAGRAQTAARYPALADLYPDDRVLVIAPLIAGRQPLGTLSLVFPADSPDGRPGADLSFVATLADATAQALQRIAATRRAQRAAERMRLLADASVALSGSLELAATLQTVARLMVPRLAEWCIVEIQRDEELETVALAHADPARARWAGQIAERYPSNPAARTGVLEVIRTGRSQLYADIPDELLTTGAVDDEHLRLLRQVGMRSALIVPLTGRNEAFGALTLINGASGHRYGRDDVAFAEDLARRAALAVETVTAFSTQRGRLLAVTRVAAAAQHAILAAPPARIGPLALAARYVSAEAEAQVGGDLYEVVRRRHATRLLIGDVRGKGLEAVRNATVVLGEFRAAAEDLDELVDVAVQLDRRLTGYLGEEDFVTALLAEIGDDGTCRLVSCGHPPAVLLRAGSHQLLESLPGRPLGLGAQPTAMTVQLHAGDRLLLHTDGLVEARRPDGSFVAVSPLLAPLATGELSGGLDGLLTALQAATGGPLTDDLALLAVQYG